MPSAGKLGPVEYKFHGIGCRATIQGVEVDFDYGSGDRFDGFDASRLVYFAEQFSDRYPRMTSFDTIESELRALAARGLIVHADHDDRAPHLWYPKDAGTVRE